MRGPHEGESLSKLNSNFKYIRVRSFILSGAPFLDDWLSCPSLTCLHRASSEARCIGHRSSDGPPMAGWGAVPARPWRGGSALRNPRFVAVYQGRLLGRHFGHLALAGNYWELK